MTDEAKQSATKFPPRLSLGESVLRGWAHGMLTSIPIEGDKIIDYISKDEHNAVINANAAEALENYQRKNTRIAELEAKLSALERAEKYGWMR